MHINELNLLLFINFEKNVRPILGSQEEDRDLDWHSLGLCLGLLHQK